MKTCPCCGYKYNLLNYHTYTRVLPEENTNYKSLHCLKCNHKIRKEESVSEHYIKLIIIIIASVVFAYFIRITFNIWKGVDHFIVNVPFMILFYILKYIFDYYFNRLECYDDEEVKNVEISHENGGNIYGIFGEEEQKIAKKVKYIVFWISTTLVLLVIFTSFK